MGGDPRLNSIHLDPVRRQDFRRARERLLGARGCETICGEHPSDQSEPSGHTIIHQDVSPPTDLAYWLTDGNYIYPLKVGVNTLGRSSDNDIVVSDAFVSRRHCAVLVHARNTCELYDIASKNGTLLNGVRLAGPTPLRPGDQIRLSGQLFTFMSRSGSPEVSSPVTLSA
jgi:pSer/pThr/pTyr-binding forkhead associated (FHA) protein